MVMTHYAHSKNKYATLLELRISTEQLQCEINYKERKIYIIGFTLNYFHL